MSLNQAGARIKECLKNKNLSQQELADLIGTTQTTISRWALGIREPDLDSLMRLAYYLKEDPNYLLGYEEKLVEEYEKVTTKERLIKQKEELLQEKDPGPETCLELEVEEIKKWKL